VNVVGRIMAPRARRRVRLGPAASLRAYAARVSRRPPRTRFGALWRRHAGVRARTSLVAVVAVGAAVTVGSGLLITFLDRNLTAGVDAAIQLQAQDIADNIRVEGIAGLDLRRRLTERNVIQVLGRDGSILAASPGIDGEPPMTHAAVATGKAKLSRMERLPGGNDEAYRVLALGGITPNNLPVTVVVGQSLDSVQASVDTVTGLLLVGVPLLLILVGGVTWSLSGRALRPVEAIRRQVSDIDAPRLGSRVPVPEAHDEVWLLANTMNRMLDRLEAAADAQRGFVSDASHELRSPLASLRATIEVAQAHPDRADWKRTSEAVLEEAVRLEHLVSDLLLLARADERGLQMQRADVDLDDIIQAETDRLRSTTDLAVICHNEPVRVPGDPERLSRAVRNLVDNAARHAESEVSLSVRAIDGWAQVEVADDGPGIPAQDRRRVFERFVRLDESRTRDGGGTGLGLAIVQQISTAHEGRVEFLDVPVGSLVRLRLPLA
jgi:signal transduction histidine kinase